MKAIVHWHGGQKSEFLHVDSVVPHPLGHLFLLDAAGRPIVVIGPGLGSIVFPENDTNVLQAAALVDGQGKKIALGVDKAP